MKFDRQLKENLCRMDESFIHRLKPASFGQDGTAAPSIPRKLQLKPQFVLAQTPIRPPDWRHTASVGIARTKKTLRCERNVLKQKENWHR